ncbi:MAG: acyl-CoA dehydrogenase family protein [Chloroflexi bacterium]|nr:acyl-CoA dehydrogenase family protein [Chloroflexota bacterium]
MDFRLPAADQALQDEARAFVRKEWHPLSDRRNWDEIGLLSPFHADNEALAAARTFSKKLVSQGWYTMHWPEEYGGRAASITTQLAYREGMAYEGAPASLGGGLVAPVLMIHGTKWQKEEFLPKVANADIDFAQGFSEPNAGSDLASLQTRAVRDGDDYVINGQKIWTSGAHYGEWYHVLVRTDPDAPKHRGISYVLMQLRDDDGKLAPGITLRPLIDMTNTRRWSEVFFDNVRVPVRNLIGEENRGWYAAMTTLSFERSGIETAARFLGELDQALAVLRRTKFNGTPILADPLVRNRLADLRIELEARRMLSYRVAFMQSKGELPVKEASMGKAWGDMLGKKVPALFASIFGEYGRLGLGERRAPQGGYVGFQYMSMHGSGIGGGTTEVQRNIIAQRGLGLPR